MEEKEKEGDICLVLFTVLVSLTAGVRTEWETRGEERGKEGRAERGLRERSGEREGRVREAK